RSAGRDSAGVLEDRFAGGRRTGRTGDEFSGSRDAAALCGFRVRGDAAAGAADDGVPLPAVQFPALAGRAAAGGRRGQAIFAVWILRAGMGVPQDFVREVRRGTGSEAADLCGRAISSRADGVLRDLQTFFTHD